MIINFPYWGYWVAGAILALIIYHYLDDSLKQDVKNGLKTYGFYVALIIGYFLMKEYLGNWQEGDFFYLQANTYGILILLLYWLGINFLGKERYQSTQAICDNRSGSCATYQEIGDYVVLNIGSIDADMFPWSWGHESWVIPKRHFHKINSITNSSKTQIFIDTNVQKSDLVEVPSRCHDFIETTNGYNKENVYYGEFSLKELKSGEKIKDPDTQKDITLKDYETKLKDTQRLWNESRTMVKGKTKQMLGYISDHAAIQKKAKGKDNSERRYKEEEY